MCSFDHQRIDEGASRESEFSCEEESMSERWCVDCESTRSESEGMKNKYEQDVKRTRMKNRLSWFVAVLYLVRGHRWTGM